MPTVENELLPLRTVKPFKDIGGVFQINDVYGTYVARARGEDLAQLIVDSVNNSTAQAERIKELEGVISGIYKDLKFRAQFTEEPKVLDISNGILHQMKEIIKESE